mgnify:CR=1 FL=1
MDEVVDARLTVLHEADGHAAEEEAETRVEARELGQRAADLAATAAAATPTHRLEVTLKLGQKVQAEDLTEYDEVILACGFMPDRLRDVLDPRDY